MNVLMISPGFPTEMQYFTRGLARVGARVIGLGHCMMFYFAYPFNRVDPSDVQRAQAALEETNRVVLDMGGIPWKAEVPAQQEIIQRMDPNTFALMNRIRAVLDPRGIMNPGNWEPAA